MQTDRITSEESLDQGQDGQQAGYDLSASDRQVSVTNEEGALATELETTAARPAPTLIISAEFIAYVVLLLFSLALRLPQLGTVPLNDVESHEALAALRAVAPRVVGDPLIARNPLMFSLDAITMGMGGSDNGTARLPTVLVGMALILLPVLFRRWLGPSKALIMSLILALSPVLLTASRTMSGSVWAMVLALGAMYCVGSMINTREINRPRSAIFGIIATVMFVLLVLMTEPAGFLLAIVVALALLFAINTGEETDPLKQHLGIIRDILGDWPWTRSVLFAAITVVLGGTIFFLHPDGLTSIGESLYQGLSGFVARPVGYPFGYPFVISITFESALWIAGLIGAYLIVTGRNGFTGFFPRFFLGWLLAGLAASFVYAGAEPSHALWLTIPLAGLSAYTIDRLITPITDKFFEVPRWGMWAHGLAQFVMMCVIGINVISLARLLVRNDTTMAWIPTFPTNERPVQIIMIILVLILMLMTYLLAGSTWGNRTAWRGLGVGVLTFLAIFEMGMGWRSSVTNTDDPRDLWRIHAVASNLNLLQDTLRIVSLRNVGAPYDIPITAAVPQDGPVAWVLRNYQFVTYIPEINSTLNGPIIIAPETADKPKFGAGYVGEKFPVHFTWSRDSLQYWDFIPWLVLHETRTDDQPQSLDHVVVWVRGDVYGAVPDNSSPSPSSDSGSGQIVPPKPKN